MLSESQLRRAMRHYLRVISGKPVSNDQPVKKYLPKGGFGTATPDRIFKSMIKYALHVNRNRIKKWPTNWRDLSINQLAPKLL